MVTLPPTWLPSPITLKTGESNSVKTPLGSQLNPAAAAGLDDVAGDVRSVEDDAERLGRDQIPADVKALRRGRTRLVPIFLGWTADEGRTAPDEEVAGRRELVGDEHRARLEEHVPRHGCRSAGDAGLEPLLDQREPRREAPARTFRA